VAPTNWVRLCPWPRILDFPGTKTRAHFSAASVTKEKKVFNLFRRQSLDSGKTEVYFNDGVSKIDMIIAFDESHENSRSRSHNKLDRLFLANIFSQA
jgi:hypothetical protein